MTLTTLAAAVAITLSTITSTPHITGIAPQGLKPGPAAQQVTVVGSGFMRGLSLSITGPAGQSQTYKDIEVQSQEEASFRVPVVLPVVGVYQFVITNTDGGVSQPFAFELHAPTPPSGPMASQASTAAVIDAITPSKPSKQSQPQLLVFNGQRFVQGLTVTFHDPTGTATTISGNEISNLSSNGFTASVVLTVEGEYTVTVTTPDGQVSNSASLSVRGE